MGGAVGIKKGGVPRRHGWVRSTERVNARERGSRDSCAGRHAHSPRTKGCERPATASLGGHTRHPRPITHSLSSYSLSLMRPPVGDGLLSSSFGWAWVGWW